MFRRSALLLAVPLLLAAPAAAQRVEITPFVGFQFAGEFEDRFDVDDFNDVDVEEGESYGVLVDFGLSRSSQIELLYSRQDTELREDRLFGLSLLELEIEYWHLGFLYQWGPGQVRPYLVLSLGATNLAPVGFDDTTRFSWSAGGGVKLMFSEHVGFRADGRFYSTLIDEDDDVFCDPFGCFSYDDSTFFFQLDVKAGIVFAF